jgi:hypothetical protein
MVEPPEPRPRIRIDSPELRGVWANDVEAISSPHEFTLDFYRFDHAKRPPERGALVARVAFSEKLLAVLLDLLHSMWESHARRNLKEIYGGGEADEDGV